MKNRKDYKRRRVTTADARKAISEAKSPEDLEKALRTTKKRINHRPPLRQRFWAYVDKRKPHECWLWNGYIHGGYGQISVGGRQMLATSISYLIHFGRISPDLWVLHKCDNPPCVNPNHLKTGTRADNLQDAIMRCRYLRGEEVHTARLTESNVVIIREKRRNKVRITTLMKDYEMSRSAIQAILSYRSWKHVP